MTKTKRDLDVKTDFLRGKSPLKPLAKLTSTALLQFKR